MNMSQKQFNLDDFNERAKALRDFFEIMEALHNKWAVSFSIPTSQMSVKKGS
jgi:hypothetical protein